MTAYPCTIGGTRISRENNHFLLQDTKNSRAFDGSKTSQKHQESIRFFDSSWTPFSKADHFEGSVHVQVSAVKFRKKQQSTRHSMLQRVAGRVVQRNASEIWFGFIDHRRGCLGAVCLSALVDRRYIQGNTWKGNRPDSTSISSYDFSVATVSYLNLIWFD